MPPIAGLFCQGVVTLEREKHKIHASLRLRERPAAEDDPRFVAWFKAEHFSSRMGPRSWLIATPKGSAMWDRRRLHVDAPVALAICRSTFNPARLNTGAMELHMPVRYRKNLPERKLIPEPASRSACRHDECVADRAASGGRRR
ncbi:DUF4130 domain-containing protein [Noviherbaspirillum saxi]|uniref:DUF4130 domain-containing protein n=1 Tax=Noviherbaspirillum saxi TaxID=2320863 RepID=UPI001314ABB7|nr:DUF4130 domain-containing protein [Noviherbaspirillum saxi]